MGMVGLIVFGLIFLIVGIVLSTRKNLAANDHCLRVGEIIVFVLSFLHIIAGIVAVVAAKILTKLWE